MSSRVLIQEIKDPSESLFLSLLLPPLFFLLSPFLPIPLHFEYSRSLHFGEVLAIGFEKRQPRSQLPDSFPPPLFPPFFGHSPPSLVFSLARHPRRGDSRLSCKGKQTKKDKRRKKFPFSFPFRIFPLPPFFFFVPLFYRLFLPPEMA